MTSFLITSGLLIYLKSLKIKIKAKISIVIQAHKCKNGMIISQMSVKLLSTENVYKIILFKKYKSSKKRKDSISQKLADLNGFLNKDRK